ncbi:MAG: hypothetical protein HY270_07800 [Deltaproteobacteria bacterium]|nr:hypothetical protein [Deltaproteobacteria bacterium]
MVPLRLRKLVMLLPFTVPVADGETTVSLGKAMSISVLVVALQPASVGTVAWIV